MNLLLDTHVWIWSQECPERLGPRARRALLAAENANAVCAISTLEIARLLSIGALVLAMPLETWIQESLADLAASTLPVTHDIAREAYALPPPFHKDPADRVLVATARRHASRLLTADERILAYRDVSSLDARR